MVFTRLTGRRKGLPHWQTAVNGKKVPRTEGWTELDEDDDDDDDDDDKNNKMFIYESVRLKGQTSFKKLIKIFHNTNFTDKHTHTHTHKQTQATKHNKNKK